MSGLQGNECNCHSCTQYRASLWIGSLARKEMAVEKGAEHAIEDIAYELHLIREALEARGPAKFAKLILFDSKGIIHMPATLAVGKTATAVLQEFVVLGGPAVPNVGPVVYSSSDVTIATVDPASGLVTAIAAGVATITGIDQGNSLTASDTVSDTAPVATVAVLTITPN